MIPALDLFCGLGGWTAGATRTGRVAVLAALNHNADAIGAHSAAHPGTAHYCQDAAEFPFETLRGIVGGGLLLASPSCRDFSQAGRPAARGVGGNGSVDLAKLATMRQSERNTAWAVVSAVEALEPRTLLVENVREFYAWRLFPAWVAALEALGYAIQAHELNAADYGGATDRARAFVTATRGERLTLAPSWGAGRGARCVGDCLDPDGFGGNLWHAIEAKPSRTRDLIRAKQRERGILRGILNNVGDGVRMRDLGELAPTLTTQSGTQLMLVDGDRVRILNPMELARIQGWRDEEITLPSNRKVASRLIGNAIPVELAHGIVAQATSA
jgi:DNA (cytosine-5)-methyltransferase 1